MESSFRPSKWIYSKQPRRIILSVFISLITFECANASGKCTKRLENFVGCMKSSTDERMQKFSQEADVEVQNSIETCFENFGCPKPNFEAATLHEIIDRKWADRIKIVIDLLEHASIKVQACTMDYLVKIAAKKVEKCIKRNKTEELARFKMPNLPSFDQVSIKSLKNSILNRLLVERVVANCSSTNMSLNRVEKFISCVQESRSDFIKGICENQQICINRLISRVCLPAFQSIKSAACECLKNDQKHVLGDDVEKTRDIIDLFVKGRLVNQFKLCCQLHGVFVPQGKIDKANRAVTESAREHVTGGVPHHLMQLPTRMIGLITKEILLAWCGDCSPMVKRSAMADILTLTALTAHPKDMLKSQDNLVETIGGGLQAMFSLFG